MFLIALPHARRTLGVVVCLLALAIAHHAFASASPQAQAPTVILTDTADSYSIDSNLELLEDPSGRLTLHDVMNPPFADRFRPNGNDIPHFGLSGDTDWVRFRVRNTSARANWLLQLAESRIPYLAVYRPAPDGSGYSAVATGDYLPFASREVRDRFFVFDLLVPRATEQTVYLRAQSSFPIDVPLTILTSEKMAELNRPTDLIFGMFYGAMLIMAGYNLFVFFSLQDRAYLYLALVIVGLAASKAAQDGLGHEYLWSAFSNRWTMEYSLVGTMLATSFFTTTFLDLPARRPRANLVFRSWRVVALVTALLVPFVNVLLFITALLGVEVILILTAILRSWQAGYRPARTFLVTWILPFITALVYVLYYFGVLPVSFFTNHLLLIFLAALALLWSFVLADRINNMRAETVSATRSLARSERQYRSIFQDSRDAIFIMTRAGEIVDLNPAGLQLFGLARADLAQLRAEDLFSATDAYEHFRRLLDEYGYVNDYETRMRCRDTSLITVLISSTLWRDDERGMTGYQGILRDVTEPRRTAQELATYRLRLEELVAARTTQAHAEVAERRRTEAALEHRVRELSALNEIAETISTVTDLIPALNVVTEKVTRLFGITASAIGEMDPASRTMRLLASFPPLPETTSFEESTFAWDAVPVLQELAQVAHPIVLDDPTDPRLSDSFELIPDFEPQHMVVGPLRTGGAVNGVLILSSIENEPFATPERLNLMEIISSTIATAIENARLYQQAQATAVADERRRLARELHDSVTQLLYSIVLLAGGWAIEAEQSDLDPQQLAFYFRELGDLGQQALGEMRLMLFQLASPVLSEIGLRGALQQRLKAVEQRVGIQTQIQASGDLEILPLQLQAELYFIAQEALNNSLRHAHASAVQIHLAKQDHHLDMVVQDNGMGFDRERVSEGMGLRNMAARAQLIGAQLEILSNDAQGTRVQLQMNLVE